MAWYGPRGSCGCCGASADCFCPVECECTEPELRGQYAQRKQITLSNFPAALEDHGVVSCADPSNPFQGVYYGVFGLNQLNGTYNLQRYPSCGYVAYKFFICVHQVASGDCKPTEQEACTGFSSLTEYVVSCLAIISDNSLLVLVEETNAFDPSGLFFNTYPCFRGNIQYHFGRAWGVYFYLPSLAYRDKWCKNNLTSFAVHRNFLMYGTDEFDDYCNNPDGLNNTLCKKNPQEDFLIINADFQATLSNKSSLPLRGYVIEISELPEECYVRYSSSFSTNAVFVEGLHALNGTYYYDVNTDTCSIINVSYTAPLDLKAFNISITSPCTILNLGGPINSSSALLSVGSTGIIGAFQSIQVQIGFTLPSSLFPSSPEVPGYFRSVSLSNLCQESCSAYQDSDICIDQPFRFKACIRPSFG